MTNVVIAREAAKTMAAKRLEAESVIAFCNVTGLGAGLALRKGFSSGLDSWPRALSLGGVGRALRVGDRG